MNHTHIIIPLENKILERIEGGMGYFEITLRVVKKKRKIHSNSVSRFYKEKQE